MAAWKNCQEDNTNLVNIAKHGFKQMIGQLKLTGKNIKNPISYFYGVCMNLFHEEFHNELENMGFFDNEPEKLVLGIPK
ncbi:hypothetical protein [Sporolactobacillus laevolacticus]|uniref:hypothetical protein n=1 Tax=Sporolactobacillus laevolacticus TaxID=33018 RepID=UPI0025B419E5|nr:hypothetical protein [Sporolactobacillus laevolacticus]MDN3956214.1 hypothetical protein [Sporolactobacillus laevolacticus]